MRAGARNLITDVAGLRVGNAQDARLKSGVTCLTADAPFVAAVDVRGGAPGTRETDLLAPDKLVARVDALVLAGGSAFGLDAASGVVAALRAAGRGVRAPLPVPIVPAAILNDLGNGGDKGWDDSPYPALGRAAFAAAGAAFEIGTAGAGTGALTARLKSGLGSASAVLPSGVSVGALVAVNPVGCVTYPGSRAFRAWEWEVGDEFGGLGGPGGRPRDLLAEDTKLPKLGEATTIAIVATDAALDKAGATRLAVAAHDGLARAIAPSHTPFDGDLVFGVSTGTRPAPDPTGVMMLGHAAAVVLARAVARGVYAATPAQGDTKPAWSEL
ncbi:peptidase T4 [Rhodobacteraceae bacterium 2CG4]|uniref:Peptidase T4 n=1 Tax=Halovulum marinum TaxID=2662447 RepID=A0A6L5Z7G2_9RHOB|nr:P1 family peptidase [Halovulum marinum]MSU92329.1 peptidase T4 [Halovulum marinum]